MSEEKKHPEGLIGKKIGMTQVFTEGGECVPVTLIQTGPCFILDVKKRESHGYSAVQLGFEPKKAQRSNKPEMGQFSKVGRGAFYHVKELRCNPEALGWVTLGQELKVGDVFQNGDIVDVSGVSIGRGFSGVVRRFKVKGQPSTRGTHEYRRHIGAVGCRKFPGRIFKNKRMPGHMGDEKVTLQNLTVIGVQADKNILLVKGGIPGHKGGVVVIRKAMKVHAPKEAA